MKRGLPDIKYLLRICQIRYFPLVRKEYFNTTALTTSPRPWKTDCRMAVVRLKLSEPWWTWWAAHSTFSSRQTQVVRGNTLSLPRRRSLGRRTVAGPWLGCSLQNCGGLDGQPTEGLFLDKNVFINTLTQEPKVWKTDCRMAVVRL